MKCPNCGFEMPDGLKYCPNCGTELQDQSAPKSNESQKRSFHWPSFITNMTASQYSGIAFSGTVLGLLASVMALIFIAPTRTALPRIWYTGSAGSSAVASVCMILFIAAIVLNFAAAVFGGIQLGRKAGYPHLIQTLCAVGVDFVALFFLIPTMQYFLNEAQVLNMGFDMNSFFQGIAMAGPETVHDLLRQINTPSVAASIVVLVLSAAAVIVVLNAGLRTPADAGPADELAEKVDL